MLKGEGSSFSLDIVISRWQRIVDEYIFLFQKHADRERERGGGGGGEGEKERDRQRERERDRESWKAINK